MAISSGVRLGLITLFLKDLISVSNCCREIYLTASYPTESFQPEKDSNGEYLKFTDECWVITSGSSERPRIKISAQQFELEENYCDADGDKVAVYDGHDIYACKFGDYCKSFTSQISSSNYMYVRFTSDAYIEDIGFILTVTITGLEASGCTKPMSGGAKAGIAIGTLALVVILIICCCCCCKNNRNRSRNRNAGVVLQQPPSGQQLNEGQPFQGGSPTHNTGNSYNLPPNQIRNPTWNAPTTANSTSGYSGPPMYNPPTQQYGQSVTGNVAPSAPALPPSEDPTAPPSYEEVMKSDASKL